MKTVYLLYYQLQKASSVHLLKWDRVLFHLKVRSEHLLEWDRVLFHLKVHSEHLLEWDRVLFHLKVRSEHLLKESKSNRSGCNNDVWLSLLF
jgi:hypothetical protein